MQNNREDGGPAFPMPFSTDEHQSPCNTTVMQPGMSLRDAFAIGATSGYLASMNPGCIDQITADNVAVSAYMIADAMIAARKSGSG